MILVPVKKLSEAKQRLSGVLTPEGRLLLARSMCEDVLATLASWQDRPAVALVTSDPFACSMARQLNFDVIPDDGSATETGVIEMATAFCRQRGAEFSCVIPADIPLIEVRDLDAIASRAPAKGTLLVPDAAGRGTNAAWRSPADLFPLRFGNDSFLPHLASAKATGLPCTVLELPSIARDIDRPEDLAAVAGARGQRRTQELIRSWDLDGRTKVAHG